MSEEEFEMHHGTPEQHRLMTMKEKLKYWRWSYDFTQGHRSQYKLHLQCKRAEIFYMGEIIKKKYCEF